MPPTAIMGRVGFLFFLIAAVIALVYYVLFYILYPKAGVVAAKVDAGHIVDEVKSEVKQKKIYKEALNKINKIKKEK